MAEFVVFSIAIVLACIAGLTALILAALVGAVSAVVAKLARKISSRSPECS